MRELHVSKKTAVIIVVGLAVATAAGVAASRYVRAVQMAQDDASEA